MNTTKKVNENINSLTGCKSFQDEILVLSEKSFQLDKLNQQFAEKGYRIINLASFLDVKFLEAERPKLLIILTDSLDACASICNHVRLMNGISNTPIICISKTVDSKIPEQLEKG